MSDSQTPQPLTSAEREALLAEADGRVSEAKTINSMKRDQAKAWRYELQRFEATVRSLEQRCEALEADKARLDWLEGKTVNVRDGKYADANIFWRHLKDPPLREAIDKARGVPSISSTED